MSVRDYVEKDYYAALGVPKDASSAEIKKSYRKLARKYHPDANAGNEKAESRFKEISEAYDVLSDDKRRKEYDEARSLFGNGGFRFNGAPGSTGAGRPGGGTTFNVDDLSDLLGQSGGGRGGDLETAVTLDFKDAVEGATVPVRIATPHTCTRCLGSGAAPGTTPRVCPTCNGAGTVSKNAGGFGFSEPCRQCRGRGKLIDVPCPVCAGSGQTTSERTLNVRIPPGVDDGQRIRLAERGTPGERGGPAGDLYVTVHVTPHPLFSRRGDSVTVTVPVTFPEAALGTALRVPTLGEPVTLKIPAGTTNGRTFRVRGRGVPRRDGTHGDQLVTVEVAVPQKLSGEAREALEKFAAASPEDPRQHLAGWTGGAATGKAR